MHMKTLTALAATAALALGATACGGSDTTPKTASAPKSAVKPVAEIPALSGKDTAVTLDSGFVKALGTPQAHPGAGRQRADQQGRRRLLPDHGRQRHLLQARHRVPVRAGHDRS